MEKILEAIKNVKTAQAKDIELAKVELLKVGDELKSLDKAIKSWASAEKTVQRIKKLAADAISDYGDAGRNATDARNIVDKLEQSAKDLGIKLPKSASGNRAKSIMGDVKGAIRQLQGIKSL